MVGYHALHDSQAVYAQCRDAGSLITIYDICLSRLRSGTVRTRWARGKTPASAPGEIDSWMDGRIDRQIDSLSIHIHLHLSIPIYLSRRGPRCGRPHEYDWGFVVARYLNTD